MSTGLVPLTRVMAIVTTLVTGAIVFAGPAGARPEAPAAPTGVTAIPGDTTAIVNWNAAIPPAGKAITRYVVKSSKGKGCTTTGALSCSVTDLRDGVSVTVMVKDVVGSRSSTYSLSVSVISGYPTAPTDVAASPGDGQVTVSFASPDANGSAITDYDVTAVDSTSSARGGETATGASSPVTVTGLTNGDTYSFTVTATNHWGTGAASFPSAGVVPSSLPTLDSTGSSFAAVAMQQWVGQASELYGINIDWQVSLSVIGLNDFAQNQMDFAASDLPYSAGQASSTPDQPYQYLPDVASGLAFMFNLTGNDGERIISLNLDPQVIDQIFLGQITTWNSPSISALNPQLAGDLPGTTISAVYRSDASGENYLLSDYLLDLDGAAFSAAQKAFGAGVPGQPSATWPTPSGDVVPSGYPGWADGDLLGENGSDNAANYVAAVSGNGAITYVESAYAKEHSLPVASLVNASGDDVQPTSADVATALAAATLNPDLTQNLTGVYASSQPGAYPLSAYSYLVAPCSPALATGQGTACDGTATSPFPYAKGEVLGQFVAFMACAGQAQMSELGYSPLPVNLVQDDFDAIGRMNGAVEPPPPTASNCKNPNVDGEASSSRHG